jgi:phage regulator Rha-like protein
MGEVDMTEGTSDTSALESLVSVDQIAARIRFIRGHKIILDADLAEMYGVPTKVLNQAVKRHKDRFPQDFMFQLTMDEARAWWSQVVSSRLRSQTVTLKRGGHIKYPPNAFTEHGVLMLSSVLNSERAIQVNIQIMRAFVRLREVLATHKELARKLAELEQRLQGHDEQILAIFEAIRQLMSPLEPRRERIGFRVRERRAVYSTSSKRKPT